MKPNFYFGVIKCNAMYLYISFYYDFFTKLDPMIIERDNSAQEISKIDAMGFHSPSAKVMISHILMIKAYMCH